jgi:hypothetical protein
MARRTLVFTHPESSLDDSQIKTLVNDANALIVHGHGKRNEFITLHDPHEIVCIGQNDAVVEHTFRITNDPKFLLIYTDRDEGAALISKQYPNHLLIRKSTVFHSWRDGNYVTFEDWKVPVEIVAFDRDIPTILWDEMITNKENPVLLHMQDTLDIVQIDEECTEVLAIGVVSVEG